VAIDTADKRASALGSALAPFVTPFDPDGSIGAEDRIHVGGWMYRGLSLVVTVVVGGGAVIRASSRATVQARPRATIKVPRRPD
jgi:hypothetical protein